MLENNGNPSTTPNAVMPSQAQSRPLGKGGRTIASQPRLKRAAIAALANEMNSPLIKGVASDPTASLVIGSVAEKMATPTTPSR